MSSPERARFVHLGDRLLAIARIRSGRASPEAIAVELDVEIDEVRRWMAAHSGEEIVFVDQLRSSPQAYRLAQRAQRLAALIAEADRTLRELHQEYVMRLATACDGRESTENFEEIPQRGAESVARRPKVTRGN